MFSEKVFTKIIESPGEALRMFRGAVIGTAYILWYRLFRKNVRIGFPFIVLGPVRIVGPGSVKLGKKCLVHLNAFKGLSIVTESSASEVRIGDGCVLGGLHINCRKKVTLGNRVMTAYSLVQDHYFNCDSGTSNSDEPILIGNNVWLSGHIVLLSGTRIGDHSVIGVGSIIRHLSVDCHCFASGSPVERFMQINKLREMTSR